MAWFTYKCPDHGNFKVSLCSRKKNVNCLECNKPSSVVLKIGTTVVNEKLDNGAMGRAVERIHNIEELIEERSKINQEPKENEE